MIEPQQDMEMMMLLRNDATNIGRATRPFKGKLPNKWHGPNSHALDVLFNGAPIETFKRKSEVFIEGAKMDNIFLVIEGVVRKIRILCDGRRSILDFVFSGEVLGLVSHQHAQFTAEAATPVRLQRLSRHKFEDAINRSAELRPLLLARACDEIAATQEQMVMLGRKTAEERVCHLLLTVARRCSSNGPEGLLIKIPMGRQDLADYLGLTIETVSRTISKLLGSGVIAVRGRHALAVRNFEELVNLAGESLDASLLESSLKTYEPRPPSAVASQARHPRL